VAEGGSEGAGEQLADAGAGAGEHLVHAARRALERDWAHDGPHRRFIKLCALQKQLDTAGARYRAVRDGDPARSAEAARRLEQVIGAALEQLALARTPPRARGRRMMWLMVGVCGFVVIRAILTLLRVRSQ
jgi:hypothetical protein